MKRSKRLVIVLTLVAFAAAVVPTLAQAKPDSGEIPYLSHGVGVDEESFGGSVSSVGPAEIPYLSQGIGVDEESLGAAVVASKSVSPDDRAFARSTTPEPAAVVSSKSVSPDDRAFARSTPEPTPIVVTKSDGWSVDLGNPGFTALALMLGLLAGGTAAAMWSRRTRLTPA